jgi:hypothetical protein
LRKRETLYGEFITEYARLLVDAFTYTLDKPDPLFALYALINRIRLCASQRGSRGGGTFVDAYHGRVLLEQLDGGNAPACACRLKFTSMRARV